jgi:ATP-dependent protease HslVU peptidase subunit
MKQKQRRPSTRKVRRIYSGGKRGDGHRLQRQLRRIRRPDPAAFRLGPPDPNLTGVAGLVDFGVYLRKIGIDRQLHEMFGALKSGPRVVYPMGAQLRLLLDAFAVGETRVFGVEGLASDPLFVHLAGGMIPSIDTLYDDLNRFDSETLGRLEALVGEQGLARVSGMRRPPGTFVHLDVDTTVTPMFGEHEGALPGPNPRYHGRPSFHPMLARVAETDTVIGAQLRPGDTGFGDEDVPTVRQWVARTRKALHSSIELCVRMDAGGDCAALIDADVSSRTVAKTHIGRIGPLLGATRATVLPAAVARNPAKLMCRQQMSPCLSSTLVTCSGHTGLDAMLRGDGPGMIKATTILAVRHKDRTVLAGDGQVTLGATVLKHGARKIRRLYNESILAGFAGSAADSFALFARFETKLEQYRGNLERAAVELARDWRSDRFLRRLEAMLIVADKKSTFLLSGTGDLIEPDDGIVAVGSGGPFAMSAARALARHSTLDARQIAEAAMAIAADICIYTNPNLTIEEL